MFELERKRGYPVYRQIREQFERRIAAGSLSPNDPLPSVRALARQLRINPNTVVRAYRELEFRGLVETRHGEGTFVSAGAGREIDADGLMSALAKRFAKEAREIGVSRADAVRAVKDAWSTGDPAPPEQ